MEYGVEIPKQQFDDWITDLRSGKYRQGKNALKEPYKGYCCLGVAMKTLNVKCTPGDMREASLPNEIISTPQWLRDINSDFREKTGEYLSSLNDEKDFKFNEIADALEITYKYGWE